MTFEISRDIIKKIEEYRERNKAQIRRIVMGVSLSCFVFDSQKKDASVLGKQRER